MPAGSVKVKGLRELNRTFKKMGVEVQKETRDQLREVGEPVRQAAEQLAAAQFRNLGDWSQMRLGVTQKLVYVAPRQRTQGVGTPRPTLAGLLLQRAMLPALEQNESRVVAGLEKMLDDLGRRERF